MKKQIVTLAAAAMLSGGFAAKASADTHVVKKGDTLSQIATKHKTTVAELKKANMLNSDFLSINQTLQLPGSSNSKPAVVTTPSNPIVKHTYTVKSGDTLSKIALSHKISLVDLMSWNSLSHYIIQPGQVLKLSKNAENTADKNTGTSAAPKAPAPAVNSAAYIVVKGDTLSTIASKNKTSVQQIKEWNKLDSDLIYIGQKLVLNGTKQSSPKQSTNEKPAKTETSSADSLLAEAQKHIGVPYKWAGSSPDGFDCSGYIYYVLNKSGSKLGRYSTEGYYSRSYYISQPQPGDLVFFENTYKPGISHMGFYVGNNQFIHSSSNGVEISSLNDSYYKKHFDGFKRFY